MNLEITCESDSWDENIVREIASECVEAVFRKLGFNTDEDVEICFLFANDSEIHLLNKTYRGVDRPTNVLSFPVFEPDDIPLGHHKHSEHCHCCEHDHSEDEKGEPCILGSIAIAYETTAREAEEQGKTFGEHLRHLIVHSLLHLLGYDHVEEIEAEKMENLEVKILEKIGVGDPYQ